MRPAPALTLLLSLLAAPVCAQDQASLEERSASLVDALQGDDAEAIGAFYAEDAVVLNYMPENLTGRAEIVTFWRESFESGWGSESTSDEVVAMGTAGFESGTYEGSTADGSYTETGKYMTVWRVIDGEWMVVREMWNTPPREE